MTHTHTLILPIESIYICNSKHLYSDLNPKWEEPIKYAVKMPGLSVNSSSLHLYHNYRTAHTVFFSLSAILSSNFCNFISFTVIINKPGASLKAPPPEQAVAMHDLTCQDVRSTRTTCYISTAKISQSQAAGYARESL